jgi:hypothetical protein
MKTFSLLAVLLFAIVSCNNEPVTPLDNLEFDLNKLVKLFNKAITLKTEFTELIELFHKKEYVFAIQKGITLVTNGIAIVKEFIGIFKTKNLTALPRRTVALCRYKLRCIGSTCAIVCAGPL